MFALAAIRSAAPERITRYTKYLKVLAPPSIRKDLETLMKTVLKDAFIDGWIEEGLKEGLKEGRAEMLLELLEARFGVPASTRKRIEACTDTAQIKAWFNRAVNAPSLDEVFAELQYARLVRSKLQIRRKLP
jgi:hypothetical protein